MHAQAAAYLSASARLVWPYLSAGGRAVNVLDVGSYEVNGSVRACLPPGARVVGLDSRAGPGVDVVGDASEYTVWGGGQFDMVVCAEVLEHARAYDAIVKNCLYWLRTDGILLVTCAGPGRAPHGVDGGELAQGEFYGGVTERQLRHYLDGCALALTWDRQGQDTYALAVK